VVALAWNESVLDDGGNETGTTFGTWTFVLPSSATSVTAPVLPVAAAGYAPGDGANWSQPTVLAAAGDLVPSYAVAKSVVGTLLPALDLENVGFRQELIPPLPSPGTLRLSAYYVNVERGGVSGN